MLRNVSCCPANDASGRSSAVADDRTAKLAWSSPSERFAYASRTSCSSAGCSGWSTIACRTCLPDPRQRVHVVGVQALHQPGDPRRQPLLRHEVPERRRRRGEPVGHAYPRRRQVPDHLPQRRVLPPDVLQVRHPQRREPLHVRAHELAPLCVLDAPRPTGTIGRLQGLDDEGGHLLDRLRRRVDDRKPVGRIHGLGPTQLVRALLERGVLRVRAAAADAPRTAAPASRPARRSGPEGAGSAGAGRWSRGPPRPAGSSRRTARAGAPGTSSSASCRTATAR